MDYKKLMFAVRRPAMGPGAGRVWCAGSFTPPAAPFMLTTDRDHKGKNTYLAADLKYHRKFIQNKTAGYLIK